MLSMMTLGSSMYGMFLPIFFMNNGVSFRGIIFYFISFCLGGLVSGVLANILLHKYGIKFFIVLRGLVEPVLVLVARFYPQLKYPIELFGLFIGFVAFSYWISMDTITLKFTDNSERGSQQSSIYGWMWIAVIIAPFIGGGIIKQFSYSVLFITSFALILFGGIISLFLKLEVKVRKKFNLLPRLNHKISKHIYLIFIRGMGFAYTAWLFSLIIYFFVNDEFLVGSFGLILGIISLIATIISGKLIDKLNKKNLMTIMYIGLSIFWIVLGLTLNTKLVYVMLLTTYFFFQAMNVPLNTLFFNDVEKLDSVTIISERMMAFIAGGLCGLTPLLFFRYETIFFALAPITMVSLIFIKKL